MHSNGKVMESPVWIYIVDFIKSSLLPPLAITVFSLSRLNLSSQHPLCLRSIIYSVQAESYTLFLIAQITCLNG